MLVTLNEALRVCCGSEEWCRKACVKPAEPASDCAWLFYPCLLARGERKLLSWGTVTTERGPRWFSILSHPASRDPLPHLVKDVADRTRVCGRSGPCTFRGKMCFPQRAEEVYVVYPNQSIHYMCNLGTVYMLLSSTCDGGNTQIIQLPDSIIFRISLTLGCMKGWGHEAIKLCSLLPWFTYLDRHDLSPQRLHDRWSRLSWTFLPLL